MPGVYATRSVAGAARLLITAPLFGVGLATMVLSLTVWALLGMLGMAGLGVAAVVGVAELLSVRLPWWAIVSGGAVFALVGLWAWTDQARATVRDGLQIEPALMVARTRVPDPERPAEMGVSDALSRLCQAVELPVPELRIRETDRPLCYTVRYPSGKPPREVLKADAERFREWNVHARESEAVYHDDRPIGADHVVVVSTGLVEKLDEDGLEGVLAHEVAHLRNADLRLMNLLLLPVFWADSVVEFSDPNRVSDYLLEFEQLARGTFVRVVAGTGVAVFSRGREYAADAAAAGLAGDPSALASALERLDDGVDDRPTEDLRAVGVVNVLPSNAAPTGLIDSHPPTERRVERLRSMVTRANG